jgi:hypothetical protein
MGGTVADMVDWRGILVPAEPFVSLMVLQLNITFETSQINEAPYETFWKHSPQDYEIYFTDALPDWPCNGQSLAGRRAALLCPQDRRLFVSVASLEAIGDAYAAFGGRPVFKLPPAFFHELAHVFWDPLNRQSQPFMAEARATAKGERSLQVFRASASKAADTVMLNDMQQFFKAISDPSHKGPDTAAVAKVEDTINEQPFTVFQTAAACFVANASPDAKNVVRQLEMPAAFFISQAPDDLRRAYYVAWSLFHYGDDKPGFEYGDKRLDAATVRRTADLVAQNQAVEGEDLTALSTYLMDVQKLARADINRKNVSCPNNGSPQ